MMQLDEARKVLDNQDMVADWLLLDEPTRDALLSYVDHQERRMLCCSPYDCMCHEMCGDTWGGDEPAYCASCKYGMSLRKQIERTNGWQYQVARALYEVGENDIRTFQLDHARELESVGDYVAAERLLGVE